MANSWPKWRRRAEHIQDRLNSGATIEELANEYDVSPKSIENRLGELKGDGLIVFPENWSRRMVDVDKCEADSSEVPIDDEIKQEMKRYKTTIDITADGSHRSDRLLRMSEEQSKDVNYLLAAHGYDNDAWELVSARSNIWHVYSKVDGIQTLYASKITVKPKVHTWTFDDLVKEIQARVKPVIIEVEPFHRSEQRMIEIPLMDSHFGNALYETYKESQRKIYNLLNRNKWDETLFVLGSDMFHADNFKSTTVSGTQLETVDMPKAWADCALFYDVLVETAIKQSKIVRLVYVPGNHDQSYGWTFVQYLKAKFPQTQVDDAVAERKVIIYGSNFVGLAHGDKARKDLIRIFPAEFPMEWAQTTNRSVHIGHLHREEEVRAKDEFGLTVRTLSTRNPNDAYHRDNGYVTAHKRFQLFEYSLTDLECIHYV